VQPNQGPRPSVLRLCGVRDPAGTNHSAGGTAPGGPINTRKCPRPSLRCRLCPRYWVARFITDRCLRGTVR
jgi:hypothetical protein